MAEKTYTWYRLAQEMNELNFGSNHIAVVEVEGRKICIARFQEKLFAFTYNCPHASGTLADGTITSAGEVVCPVHEYHFRLKNGHNTSGEGFHLRNWPVEVRADGIYVGIDQGSLFLWAGQIQ